MVLQWLPLATSSRPDRQPWACAGAAQAQDRARIVMLTSFAGLFTPQWMVGCYASSKHAAEAFSSALRAEMIPFGVEVTTLLMS